MTARLMNPIRIPRAEYDALSLAAWEKHVPPRKGQIVTADMCTCGQGTGTGASPLCRLLGRLAPEEEAP